MSMITAMLSLQLYSGLPLTVNGILADYTHAVSDDVPFWTALDTLK